MQEHYLNASNVYFSSSNNIIKKPKFEIDSLHVALSLIGTMIWVFGYALFCFYKDYIITYIRKDEKFGRGFFYKYVNYQSYKKLIICFNIIYIIMVSTILLLIQLKNFCFISGFIIFLIVYIGVSIKCYCIDKYKFDLFDEFFWIYNSFIKNKFISNKDSCVERKAKLE